MLSALLSSGWSVERSIDIESPLHYLLGRGYSASPLIVEFLKSFWGLKVFPVCEEGANFINGEPFLVDPVGVGRRHYEESLFIASIVDGDWFPVGWWLSYSHVFMNQEGVMVAYANGLVWSLGGTPCEALNLMVGSIGSLVCVHSPEGVEPWPH